MRLSLKTNESILKSRLLIQFKEVLSSGLSIQEELGVARLPEETFCLLYYVYFRKNQDGRCSGTQLYPSTQKKKPEGEGEEGKGGLISHFIKERLGLWYCPRSHSPNGRAGLFKPI